jgi:hypothetical protein
MSVRSISFGCEIGADRHGAALRSLPGFLDHAGLKVFRRFADGAPPRATVTGLKAIGTDDRAIGSDDLPHDYERDRRCVASFKPFDAIEDGWPH